MKEHLLRHNGFSLKIPKNSIIFKEGDPCKKFIIVTSGSIKVFKNSESGKEIVLYRVNPDDICILTTSCLLSGNSYKVNGLAETDVEVVAIDVKEFENLILNSVEFRKLVFQSLSFRFDSFVDKIDEVVFHSLKDRLLDFLNKNRNSSNQIIITHQSLSSELGTDREVISRILNQLKKQGLVLLEKGKITLI
jgi:CRP/FNR family transcriptional regulator